jgi:hypothetical protein
VRGDDIVHEAGNAGGFAQALIQRSTHDEFLSVIKVFDPFPQAAPAHC